MTLCIGWGLVIDSAVPLPGAMAAGDDEAGPDIRIAFGSVPAWRGRTAFGPYRVADADLFEFAMPGVATFTIRDRAEILVDPEPAARKDDIAAMLIATAIPALIWARGDILLHGAAAGASIVCGASGSGKSRWLERKLKRGCGAIADDSVRLQICGDQVFASGLPGGFWQRYGPAESDRSHIAIPVARQRRQAPIRSLIVLEPGPRTTLHGPGALAALLRHRHRPRIAGLLGTEPDLLPKLARIGANLRIVSRPPAIAP